MWLSVPIMVLKSVLRSFSASPGGSAATPSKITSSAQALYRASILAVRVSIIWKSPRSVRRRPVGADAGLDHQRHRERGGALHHLARHVLGLVDLLVGHL